MNIRDGYAMKAAVESGYNVCIISGGSNEGATAIEKFGNYRYSFGHPDKVETLRNMLNCIINPEHVLYMGDDIPIFT
jgi:3-deoxy-D-manno-octulosonate 8-phosphate phosphatase (KDO 8-P phosphatase)